MYKERNDTCGNRIAAALRLKRMRQADLCKAANVPKSSLSLYLSGAYEPKQDRLYEMAKALDVSEAWLMGYDVPMEREKPSPPCDLVLSDKEKELISLFRSVPEERKDAILKMLGIYASS